MNGGKHFGNFFARLRGDSSEELPGAALYKGEGRVRSILFVSGIVVNGAGENPLASTP